jgi:uncharacterized membrane protein (DUF106 family)
MAGKMQEKRGDKRSLRRTILAQMITLTTSGFGLVAALAWNNVIQEFVNTVVKPYLPQGYGLVSLFIYAVIVTVFAVTVSYQLTELVEKIDRKSEG